MSPARTNNGGVDLNRLVAQIVLDCHLVKWFAVNGRGLAVISAIVGERRKGTVGDKPVLDFLEKWAGASTPDNTPPPDEA